MPRENASPKTGSELTSSSVRDGMAEMNFPSQISPTESRFVSSIDNARRSFSIVRLPALNIGANNSKSAICV